MLPISALPAETAQSIDGVLFDLDDTLLDHGRLTLEAYGALWRLRENGLRLLAVTGRPCGWGEVLLRMWPVDGIVTENGTVAILATDQDYELLDEVGEELRKERRRRLQQLVAEAGQAFPEVVPARDVSMRRSDFTFDIGESRSVPGEVVDRLVAFATARGARTVRSSVHLHISYDGSDKASGAVRALAHRFGVDPTVALGRYAFVGDSENDQPGFAAFRTSVAVRNLQGRPTVGPRYRTARARGKGFAEFAEILCTRRAEPGTRSRA